MNVIESQDLERMVRETFPEKRSFCAHNDLGLKRTPVITFVHGGPDPFLDRQFDEWLGGSAVFVPLYQVLNRLCRAGVLAPGNYAVTSRHA